MAKRIVIGTFLVLLAIARISEWIDNEKTVVIIAIVALGYFQYWSMSTIKGRTKFTPKDDDDAGIDWQESDGSKADMPEVRNGWAVLSADCAVFEAKELARKLKAAGLRCRLEITQEDRSFSLWGHAGLGTRMGVLVPPSEYEEAKRLWSQ